MSVFYADLGNWLIHSSISSNRHATALGPNCNGLGNRPSFIRRYIWDLFRPIFSTTWGSLSSFMCRHWLFSIIVTIVEVRRRFQRQPTQCDWNRWSSLVKHKVWSNNMLGNVKDQRFLSNIRLVCIEDKVKVSWRSRTYTLSLIRAWIPFYEKGKCVVRALYQSYP